MTCARLSRSVSLVVAALLCAIARAQVALQADPFSVAVTTAPYNATWAGNLNYLPVNINGTVCNEPMTITTNTSNNSGGSSATFSFNIQQTKTYVSDGQGGGTYYTLSAPRTVWTRGGSSSSASGLGSSVSDPPIWSGFMNVMLGTTAANDPSYRQGEYKVTISVTGGATTVNHFFTFDIVDFSAVYGNYNPTSKGGVGAQDPTVAGQQGFWSTLFVPSDTCMTDIREASEQFTEWGPLGVFHQTCDALEAQDALSASADMNMTLGPSSAIGSGTMTVDTTPWTTTLETFRALLAGAIWFGVIWTGWALARKLMMG